MARLQILGRKVEIVASDSIVIKGAREHNLKNVDVTIPRDKLVVITGLSGSGKSSLAFDTIYAEGQRRYVESLSAYARQFLGQMNKPDLDSIDGLSPAVAIDQKTTSKNPRSTVGTTTEIYDYLRLLFARVGTPHCPECGREIKARTTDQVTDEILALGEGKKALILAPVVVGRKGEHTKILSDLQKEGFSRVRIDGVVQRLEGEPVKLDKKFKHTIDVVVDRVVLKAALPNRLKRRRSFPTVAWCAIWLMKRPKKPTGRNRLRASRRYGRATISIRLPSRVPSMAIRWMSCSRATSVLMPPMAPAPTARASAAARKSIQACSSPTRRCR